MHTTYYLLALCATTNTALAAPQQAIFKRAAIANADANAQTLDKSTGPPCPKWSYYRYTKDDCSAGKNLIGTGTKENDCQKIADPVFHNPTGNVFNGGGAWELHYWTSDNCKKPSGYRGGIIESNDQTCYSDFFVTSWFVSLKHGVACKPY